MERQQRRAMTAALALCLDKIMEKRIFVFPAVLP
jgi:hypothetical protein